MNDQDFKDKNLYQESSKVTGLLQELDLTNPNKLVVTNQTSLPKVVQNFIACQAETNAELIQFMGRQITAPVNINGEDRSVIAQKEALSEIATRQNLIV